MTTMRERRRERMRAARPALLWTLAAFGLAVVISVAVLQSLGASGEACFTGPDPCPAAGDPRVAWLTFAFFGIPLVWLLGLLVLAARATTRGRG